MDAYGVLVVFSLILIWAIPAMLLLAVVAFVVAAPAVALLGAVRRGYYAVMDRPGKKARAASEVFKNSWSG